MSSALAVFGLLYVMQASMVALKKMVAYQMPPLVSITPNYVGASRVSITITKRKK